MANRQQKLQNAVDILSKYYGVYTTKDLTERIAYENLTGTRPASGATDLQMDPVSSQIFDFFLNNSSGCYDTNTLASAVAGRLQPVNGDGDLSAIKDKIGKIFQIVGPKSCQALDNYNNALYGDKPRSLWPNTAITNINQLFSNISEQNGTINSLPNNPSKDNPNLSVILSNTKLIDIKNRYSNAIVLMLNGVPTIELARAVPMLDVKFIFNRPQINPINNRLQAPGLIKHLYGAKKLDNSTTTLQSADNSMMQLVLGNQITQQVTSGSTRVSENHSIAGMEIFTQPQTLTNADEIHDRSLRTNPVLDKFRPFMSIKDFEANVVASTGMESYKSAKLNLMLHDRSRMAEISDLIKPDLYGRTELLIEYGWSHPDGENNSSDSSMKNYYGDLINGMRVVEKYGIQNSSYTFGDDGSVNISLTLFMRGSSDLSTELVSSDGESVGSSMREIENLQRTIADLRSRVLSARSSTGSGTTREIRGVQILDLAQDNFSNMITSRETKNQLRELTAAIAGPNTGNAEARELIAKLKELFGTNGAQTTTARRNRNTSATGSATGAVERARQAIIQSIADKVSKLASTPDPFLAADYLPSENRATKRRVETPNNQRNGQRQFERLYSGANVTGNGVDSVSLAKVLLFFLAQPLSMTTKYDDVQIIFYPFNDYAGHARKINIGQFEVDLEYFSEEWARYKINSAARSSTMNIREFMRFLSSTIIDDMAAKSYGLYENNKSLFRQTFENDGQTRTMQAVDEAPILQQKIEKLLEGVTPDGSFRMPQVEVFVECLPGKTLNDNTIEDQSILRIHVYDKLATPYESLGSILQASRSNELGLVGTFPQLGPQTQAVGNPGNQNNTTGNPGIQESNDEIARRYRDAAVNAGLIETVQEGEVATAGNQAVYELKGGPEEIKEFLYKTMPYIAYGVAGSGIKAANLSSRQDPALTTVNLVRSPQSTDILPNGEQPGGLPMRIIPSEVTMQTIGCPFISFAQHFFIDFQTGTTADNIYSATTITHKISEGDFTTDIKFTPGDAYGQYESFTARLRTSINNLEQYQSRSENPRNTPTRVQGSRRPLRRTPPSNASPPATGVSSTSVATSTGEREAIGQNPDGTLVFAP
jgi:hypothetical protein